VKTQTKVYPEPYMGVPLRGAMAGGEFIPPLDRWSEKQVSLFTNDGFIFDNNLALAITEDGMFGAIDENKNWVIKPIYFDLASIYGSGDKLMANDKKNWGVINYRGREFVPCEYDTINEFMVGGNLIAKKANGGFGMLNFYNEKVVDFIYEGLIYDNEYDVDYNELMADVVLLAAKKNQKWGFIDTTGKEVLSFDYDDVTGGFVEDLVGVKKDGLWGYIDRKGNLVIPYQYKLATGFIYGGSARVSMSEDDEDYESKFYIEKNGQISE
jgi:hypothetical protein